MSDSPSKRACSVPDLSKDKSAEETRMNITRRKRGYNDEFSQAFEEFTSKITTSLNEWKMDFRHDITQINVTLKALNENTQELKSEITCIREEYLQIKGTVQNLESRQAKVEEELKTVKESMQFHSDECDDVRKKLDLHSKEIGDLILLKTQLAEIKVQNRKLRSDINANEQRDRLSNIEIVGVPEHKDENLSEIVKKIGQYTQIDIKTDDIIQVNRVTPKTKVQGRPRNIIAKLRTRLLKDNIISQARKCRLSTEALNIQGNAIPIYVNEHLTIFNKNLLKKTKEIANIKQYQFTWTKNGRIHVRKAVTTPPIYIMDEEDLRKIF